MNVTPKESIRAPPLPADVVRWNPQPTPSPSGLSNPAPAFAPAAPRREGDRTCPDEGRGSKLGSDTARVRKGGTNDDRWLTMAGDPSDGSLGRCHPFLPP